MRHCKTRDCDIAAIGCGPFNLGLAALASTVRDLDVLVFDARPELTWHRGLMFDAAELQLSFLADLVTLVDPTHPLSFLAYLRDVDRMYAFYIREAFHPTRREYEAYLRWVATRLDSLCFSHRVERVEWDARAERFRLFIGCADGSSLEILARNLVLGIGTEPWLPVALQGLPPARLLHAADYLYRRVDVEVARHVSVVGSGQSGAEVTLDLLQRNAAGGAAVSWLTRTRSFAPLDYTKLVLEMTTPAYVRYFHALPQPTKDRLLAEQWQHYKGISSELIERIHDQLYRRELDTGLAPVELRCGVTVEASALDASGRVSLTCRDRDSGTAFEHRTELVVAATGYRQRRPTFLAPIEEFVGRDELGRYRVRLDHSVELADAIPARIFVANADLHSHGVAAPDLGICAYRNATILNSVAGREVYVLPRRTAFTDFGVPSPFPSVAARPAASALIGPSLPAGEP
jgi:lysine N6-hydroxylase